MPRKSNERIRIEALIKEKELRINELCDERHTLAGRLNAIASEINMLLEVKEELQGIVGRVRGHEEKKVLTD